MTEAPLLQVVRGNPSPEELAALVTVVVARPAARQGLRSRPASSWADRSSGHRGPWPPGAPTFWTRP